MFNDISYDGYCTCFSHILNCHSLPFVSLPVPFLPFLLFLFSSLPFPFLFSPLCLMTSHMMAIVPVLHIYWTFWILWYISSPFRFHDILPFLSFTSRLFPFIRLLYGLGIRHVGINTAKDIAGHYGSFQAFWAYLLTEVEREKKIEEEREEGTEEEENEGNTG